MKTQSFRRNRRGFTLVELLVVIAIIAVLASAGFAAGNAAMRKARTVTAQAAASSVEQAVIAFQSEYNSLPVEASGGEDIQPIRTDSPELMTVLLGLKENTTQVLNKRGLKLLQVKEGKRLGNRGKDGLVYSASGDNVIGLFDPWGNPYYVIMDTNYDGYVEVSLGSRPKVRLNGKVVAVYSPGADGNLGTEDDVKTW